MNCFVIDDEPLARAGLKEFIEQTPNLKLIGEANNPMEALPKMSKLSIDVLFLDIEMPQVTGIEFLNNFKPNMPVILTTAYSQYAVECYDLDVKDYLLKPLQYDRFLRAIGRVYKSKSKNGLSSGHVERNNKSFFVKSEGNFKKVIADEILYIKSIQNYVKICLKKGNLLVHRTLKSFENQLPEHQFIKVQKSYIVNFNEVDTFDGYLLYLGQESVPVSRNMVKQVKDLLLH